MYTKHGFTTQSDLDRELDRRESIRRCASQLISTTIVMLAITQGGAMAFHLALGQQGKLPAIEVC